MERRRGKAPKGDDVKHILVVEDDLSLCILMERILRDDYDVKVMQSAEAALVQARRKVAYDAIVTDFMLPGMSGIDFIKQIRTDDRTSGVPVLMVTSHAKCESRARAAGARGFLHKPFTAQQLNAAIRKLLQPLCG